MINYYMQNEDSFGIKLWLVRKMPTMTNEVATPTCFVHLFLFIKNNFRNKINQLFFHTLPALKFNIIHFI